MMIRSGPFLKIMKTTSEICKQTINSYIVDPVIVFLVRILTKVEMQILVLISISVWMHLLNAHARTKSRID